MANLTHSRVMCVSWGVQVCKFSHLHPVSIPASSPRFVPQGDLEMFEIEQAVGRYRGFGVVRLLLWAEDWSKWPWSEGQHLVHRIGKNGLIVWVGVPPLSPDTAWDLRRTCWVLSAGCRLLIGWTWVAWNKKYRVSPNKRRFHLLCWEFTDKFKKIEDLNKYL